MVKIRFALPIVLCVLPHISGQVQSNRFVNFECSQTNPVRLSPDGTRLFAVNTPAASLSVFDLAQPLRPRLIAEIPVGIEPVSVNPRNNDEAWVVNQESDSISVVSVSKGIVVDTIHAKDEPADVVFAKGRAFVSESRNNRIGVFDLATHARLADIPVFGGNPRALAVSPDGRRVYAAFALSGNHTTVIPYDKAPPPPSPENPALPQAPAQALIVDARDPVWRPLIQFSMPDHDVVEIDAEVLRVTGYFNGVGAINLGLAVNPISGDLFVANTDARNLVRFAPKLRGHFADNRITRISRDNGRVTAVDLNPGVDYSVLPNPAALSTALAQPTAEVFEPNGHFLWVAAFGTDRIARVGTDGAVLQRIEIGSAAGATADPRHKRGPRGVALNAAAGTLYVMNRISNTISVVNTASGSVVNEIPTGSFDPTPDAIRIGRGFLYDAKLSGNGTGACATCHVDGDMDHLAWDLGDPGGNMQTVVRKGMKFEFHPMKGPMTTLSLKGLRGREPYHWRGDQANFAAFNKVFDEVMGGAELSKADMTAFGEFIDTLQFQPNPFENLDRSMPADLAGGDPNAGLKIFNNRTFLRNGKCRVCHTMPIGTSTVIVPAVVNELPQAYVVPQLRNIYQKLLFDNSPGAESIDGFGLVNDGADAGLIRFLSNPVFGSFAKDPHAQAQLAAFLTAFDTGMAPAVGYTITVTAANVRDDATMRDWNLLEEQAAPSRSWVYPLAFLAPGNRHFPLEHVQGCDLIVTGTIRGKVRRLLYQPAMDRYLSSLNGSYSHVELARMIESGDTLSAMGVPPGSGEWMVTKRPVTAAAR